MVGLEKLNKVTLTLKCYACREPFLETDKVCVRVAVATQSPLRFHDGYCMQHFTYGMYAFLEHRDKMIPQESAIQ